MAKPTVAIVHFTAPPVVGGVEMLVAVHAGLFADHGYPTRVVTGVGEPFRADVPVRVVPLLYSRSPELQSINEELERGVVSERFHAAAEEIYQELMATLVGVDVAMVHNAFTMHFNLPMTAALHRMVERGEGPHFVAWCHDLSWKNGLYQSRMRDEFPWSLLKTPLSQVEYVVVSASRQEEVADLFGLPPADLKVIPAGIDPAVLLNLEPETMDLVQRLNLLNGDLLMLAPVRITRRKNLELSIQITHALKVQGVRARLVVTGPPGPLTAGSSDYAQELRKLRESLGVEEEVVFLFEQGESPAQHYYVTDRMMYDLYSLSDLLLFSSAQEGFGIPLLEAGLFRLPVFCSDIPPFREIGQEVVNCFKLDEDPDAIAGRIHEWMGEDQSYRLRRRVLDRYTITSVFREKIEPLATWR